MSTPVTVPDSVAPAPDRDGDLPPEIEQSILDKIPQSEDRDNARELLSISFSTMTRTSPQAELIKKMTPETVQLILENENKESEREYHDRSDIRRMILLGVLLTAAFLLVLVFLLKEQPDTLQTIITPFVTLVAGGLGGYGFGRAQGKRSK